MPHTSPLDIPHIHSFLLPKERDLGQGSSASQDWRGGWRIHSRFSAQGNLASWALCPATRSTYRNWRGAHTIRGGGWREGNKGALICGFRGGLLSTILIRLRTLRPTSNKLRSAPTKKPPKYQKGWWFRKRCPTCWHCWSPTLGRPCLKFLLLRGLPLLFCLNLLPRAN